MTSAPLATNANDEAGINLTGTLDADRVPASYRTLITQGWVHHFTYAWSTEHQKAEPLTFGTIRSKLWDVLNAGHYGARVDLGPAAPHQVLGRFELPTVA